MDSPTREPPAIRTGTRSSACEAHGLALQTLDVLRCGASQQVHQFRLYKLRRVKNTKHTVSMVRRPVHHLQTVPSAFGEVRASVRNRPRRGGPLTRRSRSAAWMAADKSRRSNLRLTGRSLRAAVSTCRGPTRRSGYVSVKLTPQHLVGDHWLECQAAGCSCRSDGGGLCGPGSALPSLPWRPGDVLGRLPRDADRACRQETVPGLPVHLRQQAPARGSFSPPRGRGRDWAPWRTEAETACWPAHISLGRPLDTYRPYGSYLARFPRVRKSRKPLPHQTIVRISGSHLI